MRALIFLACGLGFLALLAHHWSEAPKQTKTEAPKITETVSQRARR